MLLFSLLLKLIDYEYLATKEKSAKARRLMTTPVWDDGFQTKGEVDVPDRGSRPTFGRRNYDSKGHEKKEIIKEGEGGQKKEEEQSFLGKYWLYIMMAFLILPRLFEAPQDGGEPAQGGAAGPAPRASR